MTLMTNHSGWISTEDSAKLLRAIFPNYPELTPMLPLPEVQRIPAAPTASAAPWERS